MPSRENGARRISRPVWAAVLFGLAVLFVLLAFDARMHWDEPFYLYTGSYLDLDQVFAHEFQRSGAEKLYTSRILHILLIHAVVTVTGPGVIALTTVVLLYLLALFAYSYVSYLILRLLLSQTQGLSVAMIAGAFTPIYLYLAFKTLPEAPALLLASIATLGLLRSMQGRAVLWLSVVAAALAAGALYKNTMLLLFVSCVTALALCKRKQFSSVKLMRHAFVAGICSLAIFYIALRIMGIELESYLTPVRRVWQEEEPFVSMILHATLEGGVFFLALPAAFLSRRKGEAIFFTIWFFLATVPLLLLTKSTEARYLAPNLVALIGLIYLSIEVLAPRVTVWWRRSRTLTVLSACAVSAIVIASSAAALALMEHEVRFDQLHTVLQRLDKIYGRNNYAILTPWWYTDFHYLRFVYPQRRVYNVYRGYEVKPLSQADQTLRLAFEDRYYPDRMIRTSQALAALDTHLVYLGFEENFSVSNLRAIARAVPWLNLEKQFAKMTFINHLTLSWMWESPEFTFSELVRHGHYVAYAVEMNVGQGGSKLNK